MTNKIKHITAFNAITNIILQIVTILSGFIIPRLILTTFGSEVNGLISSLNQLLNYVTILEGGVSSVIMANLYKPLIERNDKKISSIVASAQNFFRKISVIFIIYAIAIAIVYPIVTNCAFSYEYIFSLTLILAINLFIQYNFSLSWKILLNADKKVYIVSLIQIALVVLNTLAFYVIIKIYPNIHILKLLSALIFSLQPVFYGVAIKRYFKLDKQAPKDNNLIKERWNGFGINIAAFIHYNTDITILTVFLDLKMVSVYTIYTLVTTGLRQLVMSASSGIVPSVGQAYSTGDKKELNVIFSHYEFFITFISFFLFTIGALLISPFVVLYTSGVTDVEYYQPVLGYLLIIAEGIYCIRDPYVSMTYSANRFKDIQKYAYIEAFINIVVSLILVYKFKIIGVAIGTIIAMFYRTIFHVIYLKKHILNRPVYKFFKSFGLFFFSSVFFVIICCWIIPVKLNSFSDWVMKAFIYSVLLFIIYFVLSKFFYKEEYNYYKGILLKRNR